MFYDCGEKLKKSPQRLTAGLRCNKTLINNNLRHLSNGHHALERIDGVGLNHYRLHQVLTRVFAPQHLALVDVEPSFCMESV